MVSLRKSQPIDYGRYDGIEPCSSFMEFLDLVSAAPLPLLQGWSGDPITLKLASALSRVPSLWLVNDGLWIAWTGCSPVVAVNMK